MQGNRRSSADNGLSCAHVAAHRLHTIIDCDTVLVMDHGVAAEVGSPAQLLADHQGVFTSAPNTLIPSIWNLDNQASIPVFVSGKNPSAALPMLDPQRAFVILAHSRRSSDCTALHQDAHK